VLDLELLQDLCLNMEPCGRVLLLAATSRLGVQALMQSKITQVQGATVTYEQGG